MRGTFVLKSAHTIARIEIEADQLQSNTLPRIPVNLISKSMLKKCPDTQSQRVFKIEYLTLNL